MNAWPVLCGAMLDDVPAAGPELDRRAERWFGDEEHEARHSGTKARATTLRVSRERCDRGVLDGVSFTPHSLVGCRRTIKFSSGAGCKDFKPRNAVMPAPSAATVGSARIATTSPSPGCRPPPAAHHLLPRASIAAGSPRRSCERRSRANAAIASPAIQGGG